MSQGLAVLGFELGRHRRALLAAFLLGVPAVFIPWLRGEHGEAAVEAGSVAAVVVAGLFASLLAIALGWSGFAADQTSGRLRFYFSLPLSGGAIWAGRLGAHLLLAWGAALAAIAPMWIYAVARSGLASGPLSVAGALSDLGLAPARLWRVGAPGDLGLTIAGALAIALLSLLAEALGLLGRSRSAWLLLDLLGTLVVAALVATALGRLRGQGLDDVAFRAAVSLGVALLLSFLAAGAAQVTAGRCDLRRAHRRFSLTFWSLLGLAAICADLHSLWYLLPRPGDLAPGSLAVQQGPGSDLIVVSGRDRLRADLRPGFLVSPETGAWQRLGPVAAQSNIAFSGDGTRAVWYVVENRAPVPVVQDLGRGPDGPVPLRLAERVLAFAPWALSHDGRRLAAHSEVLGITVYDLESGRPIARAPLPERRVATIPFFAASGPLRVLFRSSDGTGEGAPPDTRLVVCELASQRRELAVLGELRVPLSAAAQLDPRGERLLVQRSTPTVGRRSCASSGPTLLVSLRPGLPSVPLAEGAPVGRPAFLPDGRLLWTTSDAAGRRLHLADAGGREIRNWLFAGASRLVYGTLVGEELVLSAGAPGCSSSTGHGWRSWRVALGGEARRDLGPGLVAVATRADVAVRHGPVLLLDDAGALVRLELRTGRRIPVPAPG